MYEKVWDLVKNPEGWDINVDPRLRPEVLATYCGNPIILRVGQWDDIEDGLYPVRKDVAETLYPNTPPDRVWVAIQSGMSLRVINENFVKAAEVFMRPGDPPRQIVGWLSQVPAEKIEAIMVNGEDIRALDESMPGVGASVMMAAMARLQPQMVEQVMIEAAKSHLEGVRERRALRGEPLGELEDLDSLTQEQLLLLVQQAFDVKKGASEGGDDNESADGQGEDSHSEPTSTPGPSV